jgi:hypothetical protein
MQGALLRRAAAWIAALVLSAACVRSQDPDSRRIDSAPRLDLRPPVDAAAPRTPPESSPPPPVPLDDRDLQNELESKERRDRLPSAPRGSGDYLALGVIVAGSALGLLLVVVWLTRRRNR